VLGVGDVAADRDNPGKPGDGAVERFSVARIDDELPAALDEGSCQREPEPARSAGNDPAHGQASVGRPWRATMRS